MNVVYLTSDLMFSSRVTAQAQALGVCVEVVGSRAAVVERVSSTEVELVVIDLEQREADIGSLIAELAATERRPSLVAYAPHVKESLLQAARDAGCDAVLSRGQFDKQCGALLRSITRSSPDSA